MRHAARTPTAKILAYRLAAGTTLGVVSLGAIPTTATADTGDQGRAWTATVLDVHTAPAEASKAATDTASPSPTEEATATARAVYSPTPGEYAPLSPPASAAATPSPATPSAASSEIEPRRQAATTAAAHGPAPSATARPAVKAPAPAARPRAAKAATAAVTAPASNQQVAPAPAIRRRAGSHITVWRSRGAVHVRAGEQIHRIAPGETLTAIASHYGVGILDVAQRNGIVDRHWIAAGAVLVIPHTGGIEVSR